VNRTFTGSIIANRRAARRSTPFSISPHRPGAHAITGAAHHATPFTPPARAWSLASPLLRPFAD